MKDMMSDSHHFLMCEVPSRSKRFAATYPLATWFLNNILIHSNLFGSASVPLPLTNWAFRVRSLVQQ